MLFFFYGLCLDNSRSISGQKMPSQFEIAWLVKSHWYTWNISFPLFRFLKTGGKSVRVFLMSFHRLNGSQKKRNFFLFIETLKNLPNLRYNWFSSLIFLLIAGELFGISMYSIFKLWSCISIITSAAWSCFKDVTEFWRFAFFGYEVTILSTTEWVTYNLSGQTMTSFPFFIELTQK